MRIATGILMAVTTMSCRTGQKPNISPDATINIEIRLNNVQSQTIDQYQLTPQLKTCADASGTLKSGTVYNFAVTGVKKDSVCQVRLVGPKASEAGVNFFPGTDDGLYFDAINVTIKADERGALVGDAFLQKRFSTAITPTATTWKIDAAFTASAGLTGTCTCRLSCSPSLTNDAALVSLAANGTDGRCIFDNGTAGFTSSSCSEMVVQCGDKLFVGKWAPPATVDTTPGKTNSLSSLKVEAAVPTPEGDVIVTPEIKKTGL